MKAKRTRMTWPSGPWNRGLTEEERPGRLPLLRLPVLRSNFRPTRWVNR